MQVPKYKLPSAIYEVGITFAQPPGIPPISVKLLALGTGLTEADRITMAQREAEQYVGKYAADIAEPVLWAQC